ncbi:hypothetical protein UA45_10405 [Morganella morganii]|uniref:Uncharacterized protein n=1 Tax=Morganella morganii TaxID=582 RepID=A0A0D8L7F0_MORMO|nr:hypothetical protein UA45_10405 [Morganella morganii]
MAGIFLFCNELIHKLIIYKINYYSLSVIPHYQPRLYQTVRLYLKIITILLSYSAAQSAEYQATCN